jgi:hypothetical protein
MNSPMPGRSAQSGHAASGPATGRDARASRRRGRASAR